MSTKLGEWMKLATKEEKEELARRAGTSVGYLRLLGYGARENPKVRLALAIQWGTLAIAAESDGRLFGVYAGDLAEPPVRKGDVQ